jgi:hypothetical protein
MKRRMDQRAGAGNVHHVIVINRYPYRLPGHGRSGPMATTHHGDR